MRLYILRIYYPQKLNVLDVSYYIPKTSSLRYTLAPIKYPSRSYMFRTEYWVQFGWAPLPTLPHFD